MLNTEAGNTMTHPLVPPPPTLIVTCPRRGCRTVKGPYYDRSLANDAMVEHIVMQHAKEFTTTENGISGMTVFRRVRKSDE